MRVVRAYRKRDFIDEVLQIGVAHFEMLRVLYAVDLRILVGGVAAEFALAAAVLEGIKLTADDGTLTLTATDIELSIEHMIVAEVAERGETVVPGKLFGDFVKKLSSQTIVLTANGSRLKSLDYPRYRIA